jgi:hypothetical protein
MDAVNKKNKVVYMKMEQNFTYALFFRLLRSGEVNILLEEMLNSASKEYTFSIYDEVETKKVFDDIKHVISEPEIQLTLIKIIEKHLHNMHVEYKKLEGI